MKMNKLVTRESFIELLNNHNDTARVIGRALVVIFNNQTNDEQKINVTRNHNAMGFTPADARSGSISAKYFIKHGTLADWMIEKWMKLNDGGIPRIAKYHSQLNVEANKKRK
jgi:hypothetical protein